MSLAIKTAHDMCHIECGDQCGRVIKLYLLGTFLKHFYPLKSGGFPSVKTCSCQRYINDQLLSKQNTPNILVWLGSDASTKDYFHYQ